MSRWPLRWQLALLTSVLVAVVIAGAGIAAAWNSYREGVADMDEDLQAVSHGLFATIGKGGSELFHPTRAVLRNMLPESHHLYLLDISTADGRSIYRSRELGETSIPDPAPRGSFGNVRIFGRLMRVGHFEKEGVVIRLAMGMRTLREARNDLLRGYLIAGPIVLAIGAAGGWWIARRALKPVESIVASAERIGARRLDERLPVPIANDELRRLTDVLNHMIDRLEASFRQAGRFTADASHELKTPLTIIRGELESALREGGLTHSQEKLLINLLEETERLTRITEGLLLLSRADAGHLKIDARRIDLTSLMEDLLEDAEILAAPWEISIEPELPERAELYGDPSFLRQLLLNLIDNAIKYNERNGHVRVSMERSPEGWRISVGNTGNGIAAISEAHVFDRFFRGDESRNRGRAGHGLGLSICREIARAHEGEIRLDTSRTGWTEFHVILPHALPLRAKSMV
jgi:heavy metal sensor kinase